MRRPGIAALALCLSVAATTAFAADYPFSGFFTKDSILELASNDGEVWAYVLGSLAAML